MRITTTQNSRGTWALAKNRLHSCAIAIFLASASLAVSSLAAEPQALKIRTQNQIGVLQAEKATRTASQKKLDSQLLYGLRNRHQKLVASGVVALKTDLALEGDGRILIDLRALVDNDLLDFIRQHGGLVVNQFPRRDAVRALVPLDFLELLAEKSQVRAIRSADRATTNLQLAPEGDIAHRADEARRSFSLFAQPGHPVDGTGIKIGVISDSVDYLVEAQNSGLMPPVTILPHQEGAGRGEGTAMLEIVHSLAPGAELYFATADGGVEAFAQNIRDLHAAGCRIIVDDITYFVESPLQDGPISQAVNDVSAAGTLFFSSAGNSGAKDLGTSATWEGDFHDGGPATIGGKGGRLHDFGGSTFNTVVPGGGGGRVDLFWADPLGHSTNDYDVYVLDGSGNVVRSSNNVQDGTGDPYETIPLLNLGERVVIVKASGADRFLSLHTGRGYLAYSTAGSTRGHNASGAANAFSVGASLVPSHAVPFVGGSTNPPEFFTADGPRRMFFNPDGSAITPGNYSSTGGTVLQKPDITAGDGVTTTVPGFAPFRGTSAAAPHAAAIAALLWSYSPYLTPAAVRSLLSRTALDIDGVGFDRNSGAGIVMAYPALAAAPRPVVDAVQLSDANQSGSLDANECAQLTLTLANPANADSLTLAGISGVLRTSSPEVRLDPAPRAFPDLGPNGASASASAFRLSTSQLFPCGTNVAFTLELTSTNQLSFLVPVHPNSTIASNGLISRFAASGLNLPIPDATSNVESSVAVSGIELPLGKITVETFIQHTYDYDLRLTLIAPDGTEVILSANSGGSGQDYGISCDQMTIFSDDAPTSISAAAPPFAGTFAPAQPLSVLLGSSGSAVNGTWKLRVEDQALEDIGTLKCWALNLQPIACFDGGGQCLAPPQIVQEPDSFDVLQGATVQFEVKTGNVEPTQYQWYFNQTNVLAQATNSILALTNVQPSQAGTYMVTLRNDYGSAMSAPAQLIVRPPAAPSLTTPLTDLAVTNGDTVTLTVAATGTEPMSYQWFFNQTNKLEGQTNASLVLVNVTPIQAGTYRVDIDNLYGHTNSSAILQVRILPTFICTPNRTVTLGVDWDFDAPIAAGDNVSMSVVNTITNLTCGAGFSATRTWAATDGGAYHATCSQTITVTDTNPPVFTCPADKTVINGSPWDFDIANATGVGAAVSVVYNNWSNPPSSSFPAGATEVGNEITLDGSARFPTQMSFEYYGTTLSSATARVRFYAQDGPDSGSGFPTPGTLLFDSGPLPISATARGSLLLSNFVVGAAVPLTQGLPDSFTWTIQFSGSGASSAGLRLFSSPVVGASRPGYWHRQNGLWILSSDYSGSFATEFRASSRGVTVAVLSTVTNILCGQSFTATRSWSATDDCGNVATCAQTVSVLDQGPPTIPDQPQDQQVALNDIAAPFKLTVSGCPPLTYQWFFNQTNVLVGETNVSLALGRLTDASAQGDYFVVVGNSYGTVTSAPAHLTVVMPILPTPPQIVTAITNRTALEGDTVHFSVEASGTAPLVYQWIFNLTNLLSAATNSTLALTNVSVAQSGVYEVVVHNVAGTVTNSANLTVFVLPSIACLTNRIIELGSAWDFDTPSATGDGVTVSVSGTTTNSACGQTFSATRTWLATDVRNYQASCSQTIEVVDTTAPALTCSPDKTVTLGIAWTFDTPAGHDESGFVITVQNSTTNSGCGQSFAATRTWIAVDECGNQTNCSQTVTVQDHGVPLFVQQPQSQSVVMGHSAAFSPSVSSCPPIGYQWFFNRTNQLAGATNLSLTLTNLALIQAGNYSLVASNTFGRSTSAVAVLTVMLPELPHIVQGLTNQMVTNGATVSFLVSAQGTPPLSYQWYFNETNILAGNTNTSLFLTNVLTTQSGLYGVAVTSPYGSASNYAALQVISLPTITCAPDRQFTLGESWTFDVPTATGESVTLSILNTTTNLGCGQGYSATRTWVAADGLNFQATCSQTIHVLDTNAPVLLTQPGKSFAPGIPWNFDSPVARAAGSIDSVGYNNWSNFPVTTFTPGAVEVGNEITLDGSARYAARLQFEYWGLNGFHSGFAGSVSVRVRFYANDGPALSPGVLAPGSLLFDSGSIPIQAQPSGTVTLDNFQLNAATPLLTALPASFTWSVQFSGMGAGDAVGLKLYGPPVVGQVRSQNWTRPGGNWMLDPNAVGPVNFGGLFETTSRGVVLNVNNTTTNVDCGQQITATRSWTAVDECGNSSTSSQSVTVQDQSAPLIVVQPGPQSVLVGQTASFTVAVSNCPPLACQWYFNQNVLVSGATNLTLVLNNVTLPVAGQYRAIITNAYGTATSTPALLTVTVPAAPSFVSGPADRVALEGDSVQFTVDVRGTQPLGYQWFFNTTNLISGATNSTLALPNITLAQAGRYGLLVTNAYGSASNSAALVIHQLPKITCLANRTVELGAPWDFDLPAATGDGVVVTVVSTITNSSCGKTFAATRTWVATDALNYQATCSQTIQVTDTIAPAISCSPNKTLPANSSWTFDVPTATDLSTAVITEISSITNLGCGKSLTVTRTWRASDPCGNSSTCSQTVTVEDQDPPTITIQPLAQQVALGGSATFTVEASSCSTLSYQWYFNETNSLPDATNASLVLPLVQSLDQGLYSVVVSNGFAGTTSAPVQLVVLTGNIGPAILTQPANQIVGLGGSATFSVVASGFPTPAYQWLFNTTNLIAGATNSSITLTSISQAQIGRYSVLVSNVVSSVTSVEVELALAEAPVLVGLPQDITVLQGSTPQLTVSAIGSFPMTYQWYFNLTNPIVGATRDTLKIKNVAFTDRGLYHVVVSSPFGQTNSPPVTLRVLVPPDLLSLTPPARPGGVLVLAITSQPGLLYTVSFGDNPTGTSWTQLPKAFQVPGTGQPLIFSDPQIPSSVRYYRIQVE